MQTKPRNLKETSVHNYVLVLQKYANIVKHKTRTHFLVVDTNVVDTHASVFEQDAHEAQHTYLLTYIFDIYL